MSGKNIEGGDCISSGVEHDTILPMHGGAKQEASDNDSDDYGGRDVPTSAITFSETEHGRMRRRQRGLDKKDLQSALKYGTKMAWFGGKCVKYTYRDISYIVDKITGKEITSYCVPLKLDYVPISSTLEKVHNKSITRVLNKEAWTSNTVLVVDTSGSMKTADMWGTRNRLGAVWVSVALDFIAHRLESGESLSTDVISIVQMGKHTRVLVQEQPCDWFLYNTIARIYNNDLHPPSGHGRFYGSLCLADDLLNVKTSSSCALTLIFLSDGNPSDASVDRGVDIDRRIIEVVENLAKKFGRRFTFTAVGIGDKKEFHLLQRMVNTCCDYGSQGSLELPSMASSSLGVTFSATATSMMATKAEMIDPYTMKQREVRQVSRESRKKAAIRISHVSDEDFHVYEVSRIRRLLYEPEIRAGKRLHIFRETGLECQEAKFIAISKKSFGEGTECFVYRFFEVGADRKTVVGYPMVAKESRLVLGNNAKTDAVAQKKFLRLFCSTQQMARKFADEFNSKIISMPVVHSSTPKVHFLNCAVYEIDMADSFTRTLVVERKLDHAKWHKWNANNGYVDRPLEPARRYDNAKIKASLTAMSSIAEDVNEDEAQQVKETVFFASDVAQAFSHFTFITTGKKRLVCDLQGVFHNNELTFSDPAIHYHNTGRSGRGKHGATDRGRKGMDLFFESHKCNGLCKLMVRGFKGKTSSVSNKRPRAQDNSDSAA